MFGEEVMAVKESLGAVAVFAEEAEELATICSVWQVMDCPDFPLGRERRLSLWSEMVRAQLTEKRKTTQEFRNGRSNPNQPLDAAYQDYSQFPALLGQCGLVLFLSYRKKGNDTCYESVASWQCHHHPNGNFHLDFSSTASLGFQTMVSRIEGETFLEQVSKVYLWRIGIAAAQPTRLYRISGTRLGRQERQQTWNAAANSSC